MRIRRIQPRSPQRELRSAGTEADKLRSIYKSVGDAQKHNFGEGPPGSKPPDFTNLPSGPLPPGATAPAASGPDRPRAWRTGPE